MIQKLKIEGVEIKYYTVSYRVFGCPFSMNGLLAIHFVRFPSVFPISMKFSNVRVTTVLSLAFVFIFSPQTECVVYRERRTDLKKNTKTSKDQTKKVERVPPFYTTTKRLMT